MADNENKRCDPRCVNLLVPANATRGCFTAFCVAAPADCKRVAILGQVCGRPTTSEVGEMACVVPDKKKLK